MKRFIFLHKEVCDTEWGSETFNKFARERGKDEKAAYYQQYYWIDWFGRFWLWVGFWDYKCPNCDGYVQLIRFHGDIEGWRNWKATHLLRKLFRIKSDGIAYYKKSRGF